jgi:hypothetical protein
VEVTLVAFYQIAQVVQPITVCVNANTVDRYSGANFHKGVQQINAAQALSFVRQRRDDTHPALNFTDLDRERRQQAFIASLAYQLKQADTFTNPIKMTQILDVAKQNTAIDSGMDVLSFARQASNLTGGNVTYYTLPIDHFGRDPRGEDVNFVSLPLIQATVSHLLAATGTAVALPAPATPKPAPASKASGVVVDAVNSSGRSGAAGQLEKALATRGFSAGRASTGAYRVQASVVQYGAGGHAHASSLASALGGLPTGASASLRPGAVSVVIGTDFAMPAGFATARSSPSSPSSPSASPTVTAVQAAGPGVAAPPPTALSALSGGGIRCVK